MKLKNFNASVFLLVIFSLIAISINAQEKKSPVFIRIKLEKPQLERAKITITGHRHRSPWRFPEKHTEVSKNNWSEWINLTDWKWHGKMKRSGGLAEYPSLRLIARTVSGGKLKNCVFKVQLADAPRNNSVVIKFTEKTESDSILFLAPYPLRENAKDFETASQMIARQHKWAKEATNGKPIKLNKFEMIANLWSMRNPALRKKSVDLLTMLGFNVIKEADMPLLEKYGIKTYQKSWLYNPDPEFVSKRWERDIKAIKAQPNYDKIAYWEISDEISAFNFSKIEPAKLDRWFNIYLKKIGFNDGNQNIKFPTKEMYSFKELPTNVSLKQRKVLYHAAKFGQWWSAKQLKQINDLILETNPEAKTSTLLPSHGFMGNAWGRSKIGMSYGMLDIFKLAEQKPVKQFGVEDWFGLNHMYGANYTWSGGQSFAYYSSIIRSAIGDKQIKMSGLITPSDDKYLRLKAHSVIGQGAKSIYFWSYGPTYVSTENYWSDLKSQYFGIAKLNRSLQKAEDILVPAKTVSDKDIGILYSVSHDLWNSRNQAAFVEKRLLWHALRHLHIQPNFLGEDDIEDGKLKDIKVLYIVDWNITKKASKKIDKWVKNGGILYLSAGAATRDEFNEPYTPNFSKNVWVDNPTQNSVYVNASFNERNSLPGLRVLTNVGVHLNNKRFNLPVFGMYLGVKVRNAQQFARFKDGRPAGIIKNYGKGKIIATGFMPMLAYGRLANFKPTTLEEKWKSEPREIIKKTLELAQINPTIRSNVPVVETSLLNGTEGSAIVLANYTYQPIRSLRIDVKINKPIKKALSVEGEKVRIIKQSKGILSLEVPLEWTDIILLK